MFFTYGKAVTSMMLARAGSGGGNGAGGSGSGSGSGEFSLMFVGGPIRFQSEEGALYSRLFHIVRPHPKQNNKKRESADLAPSLAQVDADCDGLVGGAEGAAFIRRARLMNDANREVRSALTRWRR